MQSGGLISSHPHSLLLKECDRGIHLYPIPKISNGAVEGQVSTRTTCRDGRYPTLFSPPVAAILQGVAVTQRHYIRRPSPA
ncbi:hypothetical protein DV515_00005288 [Chloebia gouldiae]|uniref:Uncharacterized protein n=1 Tax=Chloebia gouldiae TaxID=44316 RepID=A0A3L8SP77_CHLGU|nr:hypothetical protein DV515_00005288 [Chloebia gouldiae]